VGKRVKKCPDSVFKDFQPFFEDVKWLCSHDLCEKCEKKVYLMACDVLAVGFRLQCPKMYS
jgi:hypothetical protein